MILNDDFIDMNKKVVVNYRDTELFNGLVSSKFIGFIIIFRAVGAWMLRIDEVISELKLIRKELRESASE